MGDRSTSHTTDTLVRTLVEQVLVDLGILHGHSRWRVYPQDVTEAPTLTAGTPANTFGPWVEVIPLNTIPFDFSLVGFCICSVSVATNYHVLLGYNIISADPGQNMEIGERRFRIATAPITRQSELLIISSQKLPANARVMGRLKTASGNADTCTINIVLTRYSEVTREATLYPTFPW